MTALLQLCSKLWNAEPIVIALLGNAAGLEAIFALLSAFGHPLSDAQQHALAGIALVLSAALARSKAIAPDTHAAALNAVQQTKD